MTALWQLNEEIERIYEEHVDAETGEVDPAWIDALDSLDMERDAKALAVADFIQHERSMAEAIKGRESRLRDRRQAHENKADDLKAYLEKNLPAGTRLEDERVRITWRKSKRVVIDDVQAMFARFPRRMSCHERNIIKTDVQHAIEAGLVPSSEAHIEERNGIVLK